MRRPFVLAVVLLGCMAVSGAIGWLSGHWMGEHRERQLHFERERDLIAPFLASDAAYEQVQIVPETGPGGGVLMFGTVKTQAALDRLRAELVRLFGEPRAKDLISWGVTVQQSTTAPKKN